MADGNVYTALHQGFRELIMTPPARTMWGPNYLRIKRTFENLEVQLRRDVQVPEQVAGVMLWSGNAWFKDKGAASFYLGLDKRGRERAMGSLLLRKKVIEGIVTRETDYQEELKKGVVNIPPYKRMEHPRSCMAATLRSIFEDITGVDLDEAKLLQIASSSYLTHELQGGVSLDTRALDVLNAPSFRRTFNSGQMMRYFCQGFSIGYIGVVAQAFKEREPDAKVYFVPLVGSEVVKNSLHAITMLEATKNQVVIHDPSNVEGVGGAMRKIGKKKFLRRWGRGYGLFGGDMLVSVPEGSLLTQAYVEERIDQDLNPVQFDLDRVKALKASHPSAVLL